MQNLDIRAVADQYRDDGYAVVVGPANGDLPDFLAGLGPDILARKADENVVVEVVTRGFVAERRHFLEYWRGKVNALPGWRFDLVVVDPSPWLDEVSGDAMDPGVDEIREGNREARRTLDHGFAEPAFLFAWSLAEAAMRLAAGATGVRLASQAPAHVAKQLVAAGVLSGDELESLQRLMKVRNSLAHGLKTAAFDAKLTAGVIELTERLLEAAEVAGPRLAGA